MAVLHMINFEANTECTVDVLEAGLLMPQDFQGKRPSGIAS